MELFTFESCSGCAACANVCPHNAIAMDRVYEGFLYPRVDEALCVHCGLCQRACPLQLEHIPDRAPQAFAAYARNAEMRASGSSGGLFSVLAKWVLEQGGTVYGAAVGEDLAVSHVRIASESEVGPLRQSKYVQSNIGLCYRELKEDADEGKTVLFVGTPCQVAGAKSYLGQAYKNVLLVDFVCHGVPSGQSWNRYLKHMEQCYGSRVTACSFRDKHYGWKQLCMVLHFENGKKYIKKCDYDIWYRLFHGNIALRNSCGDCHFKGGRDHADLTLGDLWGASAICPDMDGEKGTSLLVIRSAAGQAAVEAIAKELCYREIPYEQCVRYNKALEHSEEIDARRTAFLAEAEKGNLGDLVDRYFPITTGARLKKFLFAATKKTLQWLGLLKLIKKMRKK